MKKIILFTISLFLYLSASAQSSIGDFWGLRLGQTQNQVTSTLNNKGLTCRWKDRTNKGELPCEVKGPYIGGIKFQYLTLYFKDGVLVKGMFHSYDGWGTSPEDWHIHESGFNASAMNFQKTFNKVKSICLSKYGSPHMDTENIVEWQDGNSKISVEYEYELTREPYLVSSWTRVMLIYETVDFSEF